MADALSISAKELEYASDLQLKNNNCFFCNRSANGNGLKVQLYDPKTVQHSLALKKWHTTTITVPRCKRCANVDETLKRYQTRYLFSALIFMAVGAIIGIVTYDIHQMDILPVISAVVGFLFSLTIFIFRVRKLIKIKGSSGSTSMQYLNYAPIQYLQERGWKLGTG
jgi:hypothetical protein